MGWSLTGISLVGLLLELVEKSDAMCYVLWRGRYLELKRNVKVISDRLFVWLVEILGAQDNTPPEGKRFRALGPSWVSFPWPP